MLCLYCGVYSWCLWTGATRGLQFIFYVHRPWDWRCIATVYVKALRGRRCTAVAYVYWPRGRRCTVYVYEQVPRDRRCTVYVQVYRCHEAVAVQFMSMYRCHETGGVQEPDGPYWGKDCIGCIRVHHVSCCYTGCSLNIVFFLKIFWFFWTQQVLLQRWWLTCHCINTLTPRRDREKPESEIYFKIFEKHNI